MSRYSFIYTANNLIEENFLPAPKTDLFTSGDIAKQLKISDAIVKKAIRHLGIKASVKKGVSKYYSKDSISKIKAIISK